MSMSVHAIGGPNPIPAHEGVTGSSTSSSTGLGGSWTPDDGPEPWWYPTTIHEAAWWLGSLVAILDLYDGRNAKAESGECSLPT